MLLAAVAHERVLRGGTATEVRTLAARALDGGLIAEQTGDSGLVMDAGFAIVTAGDLERADRCWDEALADVRRRGSVIGFARTSCLRAMLRLAQGRLLDAESEARNAIEVAWEPGYRVARMAHAPLVEALVAQGEIDAAEAALTTAGLDGDLTDGYMLNFVLFARGKLRLAQGRNAAGHHRSRGARTARDQVARAATPPSSRTARCSPSPACPTPPVWPPRRCELARALGCRRRPRPSPPGARPRDGRPRPAAARASAVLDGSPWRLEHAQSLVELGAATRRSGHRTAAREPLYAGMELAHACAARPLVDTGPDGTLGERRPPASSGAQRRSTPSPRPSAGSPRWLPTA